jgi:hypothetical protein
MKNPPDTTWIAFARTRRIASGAPREVVATVKAFVDGHPQAGVLIFDAATSHRVEIDLRGAVSTVLRRLPPSPAVEKQADETAPEPAVRTPGRPKLGVTAREVTLLPRHWEWLAGQPGGTSVALRKLVEQARRASTDADRLRAAQESAYRFMTTMAGDQPGYEEAIRALFAGDQMRLQQHVARWPRDVRSHVLALGQATVMKEREREHAQ